MSNPAHCVPPEHFAYSLRFLSGVMDEAARNIQQNGDLDDLDVSDLDNWIADLEDLRDALASGLPGQP